MHVQLKAILGLYQMTTRVTYPNVLTPIQTVQQRRAGRVMSVWMAGLGVSNPEMLL